MNGFFLKVKAKVKNSKRIVMYGVKIGKVGKSEIS